MLGRIFTFEEVCQLESAVHLSLAAGENAMQIFAARYAIAYYEQARQLLTERLGQRKALPALPVTVLQQLYTQLGRAYEFISEADTARAVYKTMLALSQEFGTPTLLRHDPLLFRFIARKLQSFSHAAGSVLFLYSATLFHCKDLYGGLHRQHLFTRHVSPLIP